MRHVDIAVVGGGLGGLAAVLALRSRGFNAHAFGKLTGCEHVQRESVPLDSNVHVICANPLLCCCVQRQHLN
jgi:cation diffusion facilitator CzcD-associated flavoprotein CzcO